MTDKELAELHDAIAVAINQSDADGYIMPDDLADAVFEVLESQNVSLVKWRKYPEQKPSKDLTYLCHDTPAYAAWDGINDYVLDRWNIDIQKFSEDPCIGWWLEIPSTPPCED